MEKLKIKLRSPVKVIIQKVIKLIPREDVVTGIHHGAPGQILIDRGVLPPIQLVHDHFPNSVAPRGTILQVAMTFMWHPKVHRVRPEGWIRETRRYRGIVEKCLLLHHHELVVASHAEVRRADADDRVVRDVGEFLHYYSHAC